MPNEVRSNFPAFSLLIRPRNVNFQSKLRSNSEAIFIDASGIMIVSLDSVALQLQVEKMCVFPHVCLLSPHSQIYSGAVYKRPPLVQHTLQLIVDSRLNWGSSDLINVDSNIFAKNDAMHFRRIIILSFCFKQTSYMLRHNFMPQTFVQRIEFFPSCAIVDVEYVVSRIIHANPSQERSGDDSLFKINQLHSDLIGNT